MKAIQLPGISDRRRVRIPLIKTMTGDLDYEVALKFGGRMHMPNVVGQVTFPLVRTRNIQVEQSQVKLHLPTAYRWFDFGGTMRRVTQGDLLADFLAYKTKQVHDLRRVISGSASEFSKARAASNLKQLELDDARSRR